jgi:hypothetical protein
MQNSRRKLISRVIRSSETEHISTADRASPEPGSQRISDDSAKSCVCSTVRFNGGRMIVSFDFDANILAIIKLYNASVIFEDADTPVIFAE